MKGVFVMELIWIIFGYTLVLTLSFLYNGSKKRKDTTMSDELQIVLQEYEDIRAELRQRITQRDTFFIQFIAATLTVITLAASINWSYIIFLPIVSIFYAYLILSSYQVHERLVEYIREELETWIQNKGEDLPPLWESYCSFERDFVLSKKISGRKKFFQYCNIIIPVFSFLIYWWKTNIDIFCISFFFFECIGVAILISEKTRRNYSGLNKLAFCDWQDKKPRTDESQKAVFWDRDGTLHVDKVMTHKLKDLELLPYAKEKIKEAHNLGYKNIIVTNQSAIAKGYYSCFRMHMFNWKLRRKLKYIDAIYFCPHSTTTPCNCHKPKTGMFERAKREFCIDMEKSYMIGDRIGDMKAGINANIKNNIFVTTGIYADGDYRTEKDIDTTPCKIISSLKELEF